MRRHLAAASAVVGAVVLSHHGHHVRQEGPTKSAASAIPPGGTFDPHDESPEVSRSEPLVSVPAPDTSTTTEARRVPPPVRVIGPVDVTAYCQDGTMADGRLTHVGAAASNDWPFGTLLEVVGYGEVTVEDRIGSGSQLDIWMPSCAAAREFGRRWLEVEAA